MPNYDINYDDARFKKVESEKSAALTEAENTYNGMINQSDQHYQAQIDASKDWANKQTQLQNEKTDFAIKEIEQQKEQTKKDYTREQSGAYVDWRKQSNEYGAEAEQMASAGLTNTGYSESSQVSMYNTYQSRVATARESYSLAIQNYNNSITEARLQNNSILAEIAAQALEQQLKISLEGFQYKNTLIQAKTERKTQIESEYYARYQDVLKQINTENALAEQVRQFNAQLAEEQRQFNAQQAARSSYSYSGGGGGYSGGSGKSSNSGGSYTLNNNKSSSTSKMSKATIDSIKKAGIGPVSQQGLANAVASGKVNTYKDSKGNTIVTKAPVTAAGSGVKPMVANSNAQKKKTSTWQKVLNWFKGK
jgi:hypothetical protein